MLTNQYIRIFQKIYPSLKKVIIKSGITDISGSLFYACKNLEYVSLPETLKSISPAFKGCTSLKKITINSKNKSFYCSDKGVLYNKDKTIVYAYPASAPAEKYTLFKTVTVISRYAFNDCQNLKELTIPKSVKQIELFGIGDNNSIKIINYNANVSEWAKTRVFYESEDLDEELYKFDKTSCNWRYQYQYGNRKLLDVVIKCKDGYISGNHKLTASIKEATFKQGGTEFYKCNNCNYNYTITTAKLKNPSLSSVTKGKKSFVAKWKSVSGIDGYQIQYSKSKSFSKYNKTVTISGYKSTKKAVKKLKAKQKYYVRIRGYKYNNGVKNYSPWSSKKTVTTKK